MANLNTHPHIEDVIFNKPSLKELVRLIKNGTINAIWPSTNDEFNDWNKDGYKPYVDDTIGRTADRLKLKSLNTSMTIYYGDHQDSTSSGEINLTKTQENYNQVINAINSQKQEIVNLNYYDNVDDIYPISNSNLTLSLDSSTGQINNTQNVINYENTILTQYRRHIQKINDFINRINNFKPSVETTSLTLSDEDLINDYNEFFINSTNEINENFRNTIALPEWDIEDVNTTLIDPITSIYDFSKINNLYKIDEKIIDNIFDYIENYYKNTDQEFTINKYYLSELKLLESNYKLYQSELEKLINDFYSNWENDGSNNLNIIKQIYLSPIAMNLFSGEEIEEYEIDIEKLYEKYVYPWENFVKYLYLIKNSTENTANAELYWENLMATLKEEVDTLIALEQRISAINYNFITVINNLNSNTFIFEKPLINILFLSDGTIQNSNQILDQIQQGYNILHNEEQLLTQYQKLIPANYLPRTSINLSNYSDWHLAIINKFNEKISINDNSNLTYLKEDQNYISELYNDFKQEYFNFLTSIKNLNIHPVSSLNFILQKNGISNINEIQNTIINQKNKLLNHYKVLTDALSYNMEESINNLNIESQNILTRINNATVVLTDSGNEQDFIDQVIDPDKTTTEDDYTITAINLLLKRITNNSLSFSEEQIIPKISEDFLTIYNKDTVINNLYFILSKGESLNREYVLINKIDNINSLLESWRPIYSQEVYSHYTCIAVGSDIQFPYSKTNADKTSMSGEAIDGTITVLVDNQFYHYPLINNQADIITKGTRNGQILTVGGLVSALGGDPNTTKISEMKVGDHHTPIHMDEGFFIPCNGVVSGIYKTQLKGGITYWDVIKYDGTTETPVGLQALKLFGAVYNDYAEYRSAEAHPGRCIIENGDGTLSLSSGRLQLGANIVSDTYGFAIGETNNATCPVAVCGRVLAYPLESKALYTPGAAVCSGPDGTISLMTREEIREWPDAIVGYVSEVPTYDTWGSDNVSVNGRVWIKIK